MCICIAVNSHIMSLDCIYIYIYMAACRNSFNFPLSAQHLVQPCAGKLCLPCAGKLCLPCARTLCTYLVRKPCPRTLCPAWCKRAHV